MPIKLLLSFFLLLFAFCGVHAQQVLTTVDSYTGDTTLSTSFDTLNYEKEGVAPDRVVGVRTIHKGKSTYWLFFYFSTSDITDKSVKISNKNFAYFIKTNNEYLRMPYKGKAANYSGKDNAGFFLDITDYVDRLQSAQIKIVRFETSQLYHEILIPQEKLNAIAQMVNKLVD